jgi:hypothetical protein
MVYVVCQIAQHRSHLARLSQKCELLIREALLDGVSGVVSVDIDRPESHAMLEVSAQAWATQRQRLKRDIVDAIQVHVLQQIYKYL